MKSCNTLIFGSCVTRDIFSHGASEILEFKNIFSRTSPVSLLSQPIQDELDLSKNSSPFQRRMVSYDLSKHFWDYIENEKFDLLIFDFIDERFKHLCWSSDHWLTFSNEFAGTGISTQDKPVFGWPDDRYKTLFVEGLRKIRQSLERSAPSAKIVLNEVYWADSFDDGSTLDWSMNFIRRNNEQLGWVHDQFKKVFPGTIVLTYDNETARAKRSHPWGTHPFHYCDAFYRSTITQLRAALNASNASALPAPQAHVEAVQRNKPVEREASKPAVSLSVDVEALISRTAEKDKVGRLMWGRFGDKLMGVPLIIDILEEFGVGATFFLEYLGTLNYGKEDVFKVGRYILDRGQTLEVHAHPELIPAGKRGHGMHSFAPMNLEMQTALMRLTRELYFENTGRQSRIFRGGGLRFNASTPLAARQAGFAALSNYYGDPHSQPGEYFRLPENFDWSTGVHELTVSACLDEIIQCGDDWEERLAGLLAGPARVRHLFMHSWSLIRREGAFHDNFDTEYVARFRLILQYLKENYGIVSMEAPLKQDNARKVVPLESLVESPDGRAKVSFDRSPTDFNRIQFFTTSKARSILEFRWEEMDRTRFLKHPAISPTLQPLKVADFQNCFVLDIRWSAMVSAIPYILSGHRAYIQLKRQAFPGPGCATEILNAIFRRHPEIDEIVFSLLYGDDLVNSPFVDVTPSGSTFILTLPSSFAEYKDSVISKSLRQLTERKERTLYKDHAEVNMHFLGAGFDEELTKEVFTDLIEIIRHRMLEKAAETGRPWSDPYSSQWIDENFAIYRDSGLCSYIEVDGQKVAATLSLLHGDTLSYMATGHIESIVPVGETPKIVLFRTIERFIAAGGRVMQLGGGNFGYKDRFGAVEVPLYSGVAHRFSESSKIVANFAADEIPPLLARGCNLRDIHIYFGVSAKKWIGSGNPTAYCFDFSLERFGPPPAGWRGWHPPLVDAVHLALDRLQEIYQAEALFDWNCAAGRNLIAAAEYGIASLGGLVFGEPNACHSNFAGANLARPDIRTLNSPQDIRSLDLQDFDVFMAYHPCREDVMLHILDAMKRASAKSGKPIYFVYICSVFRNLVLEAGFAECDVFEEGKRGWRFEEPGGIFTYHAPA